MQVGDLVYVPYFEDYGIIVEIYHYADEYCYGDCWRVVYPSGNHSDEYTEDMEVVCK